MVRNAIGNNNTLKIEHNIKNIIYFVFIATRTPYRQCDKLDNMFLCTYTCVQAKYSQCQCTKEEREARDKEIKMNTYTY